MLSIIPRKGIFLIFSVVAVLAFANQANSHVGLNAPNGGEVLQGGSNFTISWEILIAHTLQNWDLWYSTTGAGGPWIPIIMDLIPGDPSAGSIHFYNWTVPDSASNQVRVRVRMDNNLVDYIDISNSDFTIEVCTIPDRDSAIAYFRSEVTDTMALRNHVVVYTPQFLVGPFDIIIDGITDSLIDSPDSSYLFFVDHNLEGGYAHKTQFYLLSQNGCNLTGPIDGEGFPVINGVPYYSADDRYSSADTVFVGSHYTGVIVTPAKDTEGSLPGNGNDSKDSHRICLITVNGFGAGSTAGARDVACANTALAPTSSVDLTSPTKQELCDLIDSIKNASDTCDKLYFYYTGHGPSNKSGIVLSDGVLTHYDLACKLKETGIEDICVILDACYQGDALDDLCQKGVEGLHFTSSYCEVAYTIPDGLAGIYGMAQGQGLYSYWLWWCIGQGHSGVAAQACAIDSANAGLARRLANCLSNATSAADSAECNNKFGTGKPKPQTGWMKEFAADDRLFEFDNLPGCTLACVVFYGDSTIDTCRNATLYCEGFFDSTWELSFPWICVGTWNYNHSGNPRYFRSDEGTGKYKIKSNSNSYPVRVGVTWPPDYHAPTPGNADIYPAITVGWPDGSANEFNPDLGNGQFGGICFGPDLTQPHSLCDIPAFIGGPYYSSLLLPFPLQPDFNTPEMYEGGDPFAPYNGQILIDIHAAGIFDTTFNPVESMLVQVIVSSGEFYFESFFDVFVDFGTPTQPLIRPIHIGLPPLPARPIQIEIIAMNLTGGPKVALDSSGILQLDAVEVSFDGPGPTTCCIVRGNINGSNNGLIDISDLTYLVAFMFGGGPPPPCPEEADLNGSPPIDISDLTYLVAFMFGGGPAPVPCP